MRVYHVLLMVLVIGLMVVMMHLSSADGVAQAATSEDYQMRNLMERLVKAEERQALALELLQASKCER